MVSSVAAAPDALEDLRAVVHVGAVELICVDVAVLVGSWFGVGQVVSASALPAPTASSSSGSTEGQQSEKNGLIR